VQDGPIVIWNTVRKLESLILLSHSVIYPPRRSPGEIFGFQTQNLTFVSSPDGPEQFVSRAINSICICICKICANIIKAFCSTWRQTITATNGVRCSEAAVQIVVHSS